MLPWLEGDQIIYLILRKKHKNSYIFGNFTNQIGRQKAWYCAKSITNAKNDTRVDTRYIVITYKKASSVLKSPFLSYHFNQYIVILCMIILT